MNISYRGTWAACLQTNRVLQPTQLTQLLMRQLTWNFTAWFYNSLPHPILRTTHVTGRVVIENDWILLVANSSTKYADVVSRQRQLAKKKIGDNSRADGNVPIARPTPKKTYQHAVNICLACKSPREPHWTILINHWLLVLWMSSRKSMITTNGMWTVPNE